MPILTKRANKTPLGIYVHVPFCRSKCQYCDFYSMACKDDKSIETYLRAVCAHIKESGALTPGYKVDTIYFGGGTPSYLGADALATILTTIRRSFDVDANAEINRIIIQTPPAEVFPVVHCEDCEYQPEVWEDGDAWEGKRFCPVVQNWVEKDDYCHAEKRGEEDDTV